MPEVLISDIEDVLGSVWLATAILSYERGTDLDPEEGPFAEEVLAFRQVDIQALAERLCAKTVHSARTSQWTNGDHPKSNRNYLRAVGSKRRLSRPDEFGGEQVTPSDLLDPETPVFRDPNDGREVAFGELVMWVHETYTRLVEAREADAEQSTPTGRRAEPEEQPEQPKGASDGFPDGIIVTLHDRTLVFHRLLHEYEGHAERDLFAAFTSRSVAEMLDRPRYSSLRGEFDDLDDEDLDRSIGEVLLELKQAGDERYRRFLNEYGDRSYTRFKVDHPEHGGQRGIYIFLVNGQIRYVGRCKDAFAKRFNQGYGRISARNCYKDGQSTNCRLNHLVSSQRDHLALYVHALDDDGEIERVEQELIRELGPEWNLQGA